MLSNLEPKKVAKKVRHHRNFSGALQQNNTSKTGNVNYETCPPWLQTNSTPSMS